MFFSINVSHIFLYYFYHQSAKKYSLNKLNPSLNSSDCSSVIKSAFADISKLFIIFSKMLFHSSGDSSGGCAMVDSLKHLSLGKINLEMVGKMYVTLVVVGVVKVHREYVG